VKNLPIIAIVGQTNAGKSSLFNRIVGKPQAIVAREEGTTRDRVMAKSEFNRKSFVLIDTAGLKKPQDEFEATIQDQITEVSELAEVIIVTVDGTTQITEEDRRVAKLALKTGSKVILAVNKADHKGVNVKDFERLGIKQGFLISANHGDGVPELLSVAVEDFKVTKVIEDDAIKIAFVGRPNAGKSALFNALSKKQSAIVANVAGTTRDVNHVDIKYHDQKITLLDTAGIRRKGKIKKGPEDFSVLRTMIAINEADICCLLLTADEYNTKLDQYIAGEVKDAGKGLIIVISKWDAVETADTAGHIVKSRRDRDNIAENTIEDSEIAGEIEEIINEEEVNNREFQKTEFTAEKISKDLQFNYQFVYWAPLVYTSSVTGQNVTKLLDLFAQINETRSQKLETKDLNNWLQKAILRQPPASRNRFPKLKYANQTNNAGQCPEITIHGRNTDALHFSYKRYLENSLRDEFEFKGTALKILFSEQKTDDNK